MPPPTEEFVSTLTGVHTLVSRETPTEAERPGRVLARLLPFGERIVYDGETITFDEGSVSVPEGGVIPVTVDHGDERIGRVVNIESRRDGLYAELQLSDTTLGRDVRALLLDGVITDVSAGIGRDTAREFRDQAGTSHRFGALRHVSLVYGSRLGGAWAAAKAPSRVLAAFTEETPMPEPVATVTDPAPTSAPTAPAPAPATDEFVTVEQFDNLQRAIANLNVPRSSDPEAARPGNFRSLHEFIAVQRAAGKGNQRARERMDLFYRETETQAEAMAAVISEFVLGDDTTTTATGFVPDYLSSEIIGRISARRPYVASTPSDPIGDYGMSAVYPHVTGLPDVDVQALEKTEVTSQPMTVTSMSVDLVTYAGATNVSAQLVERSQPSFIDRLYKELAAVYARRTEAAAIAHALANAGNSSILANFGTSASASWAALMAGAANVAADSDEGPAKVIVAMNRFFQLAGLVDSDGRPILDFTGSGQNTQGTVNLRGLRANWGGIEIIGSPQAADDTAMVMTDDATATLEMTPQQLRATDVGNLGVDVGVWGLFAHIVKYPDSIHAFTIA